MVKESIKTKFANKMKLKAAYLFACLMLGMLLMNAFVCVYKYNTSQFAEFIESEESESPDTIKVKSDHVINYLHEALDLTSSVNSNEIYFQTHENINSVMHTKPETPPPDLF